ncbi:hypothetical protein F2P56_002051 [Juglans regia]|uniref:Uncharacterized protein n=1 Tax=Juglans regia TaxID=51240 RepID=A0A833Y0E2_JUGRE|nr:hypothetical protein F2P56_002051 [Juglans regia]
MPKAILAKLNRLFSSFFWGETHGKAKRKWKCWRILCVLGEERGMGVQDLAEVQGILFVKFAWQFLTHNSWWARYFKAKYAKHGIVVEAGRACFGYIFWKKVAEKFPLQVHNSRWKV